MIEIKCDICGEKCNVSNRNFMFEATVIDTQEIIAKDAIQSQPIKRMIQLCRKCYHDTLAKKLK